MGANAQGDQYLSDSNFQFNKHQYPLFSLRKIFCFKGKWSQKSRKKIVRFHALIFLKEGFGKIIMDGITYHLTSNKLFLLTPGMSVEVQIVKGSPIEAYYATFQLSLFIKQHRTWAITKIEKISEKYSGEISMQNWLEVDRLFSSLYKGRARGGSLHHWKQQMKFEELLYMLMEGTETVEEAGNWARTMKHYATYMNKHYAENIKVGSLSKLCGLNPSTFSRLFKKTIGMAPSDYLTHIRIERAKEMLRGNKRLKEVSESMGFCDEYYFSRIFKKVVGVAPSIYIKKSGERKGSKENPDLKAVEIAVTYIDEVDHLIALGLLPMAVPNDHSIDHSECTIPYLKKYVQHVEKIGCEQAIRTDLLLKLNPTMIIAGRFMHEWGVTELDKIAQTYYYYWEVDWRNTHRDLAKLLGCEEIAEQNIVQFNQHVLLAKEKLHRGSKRRNRFAFLEMTNQGIRVSPYNSNGGWLLFQQLGLIPAPITTVNNWNHLVSAEEAAEIDADYLIIGRRSGSQQVYKQFMTQPATGLRKVLEVPRYPWAKGGPIAYAHGINYVLSMFEKIHM